MTALKGCCCFSSWNALEFLVVIFASLSTSSLSCMLKHALILDKVVHVDLL